MSIDSDFLAFHQSNPHIYDELVRLAREARARGHQKLGIGMLWEVMRWNKFVMTTPTNDEFKLNNNFRSRYARIIMENEPELSSLFETRSLRSE